MTSKEPLEDRCGAQTRDGNYCTQYPVEGSNRCRMHGGTADNAGENNGNYKHGLYADVGVNEDERDLIERLDAVEDVEKFDVLVQREMARYLRAAGLIDEPEMQDVTKMDPQGNIHKVDEKLDMNDGPVANRASLISSLLDAKSRAEHRLAKIDEGEKHRVETSMDDEDRSDLLDAIDGLQE